MNDSMLYICADDYGLTDKSCNRIEDCIKNGALNKISVLPNSELSDLKERVSNQDVMLTLHLNLVEGNALSNPEKIDLLVDTEGKFKYSFGGLLKISLSNKKKVFENQLYEEIKNQILFFIELIGRNKNISIDSHQHTHMIPLIFKVLMRVIREEKIEVEYLRIPSEPILPYLMVPSLYLTYKPVNLIKQWLLKLFCFINKKEFKKTKIKTALFMGILFSGHMDEKRVMKILPFYLKLARKNYSNIELLFHPGYLDADDDLTNYVQKGFDKFYFSNGRKIEYDALLNIKSQINELKEVCNNALH